jgi:hypothetical protein
VRQAFRTKKNLCAIKYDSDLCIIDLKRNGVIRDRYLARDEPGKDVIGSIIQID